MRISILFIAFAVGVCDAVRDDWRSIAVESDGSLSFLDLPHDGRIVSPEESLEGQMDEISSFLVRGENEDDMHGEDDDGDDDEDVLVHGGDLGDNVPLPEDLSAVQDQDEAEVEFLRLPSFCIWNFGTACNNPPHPPPPPGHPDWHIRS